ncbi:hypothetical protein AB0M54_18220 [Actinoplanes sp. NPDC051470]|uniref:hypothetical protein n=1 Tax=Actinoplanes sp. NPDC051470 TaxID=3157224 RepID=UPI00342B6D7C
MSAPKDPAPSAVAVPSVVFSSAGGAERSPGVPLYELKRHVEDASPEVRPADDARPGGRYIDRLVLVVAPTGIRW